jgi:hypothetical protein
MPFLFSLLTGGASLVYANATFFVGRANELEALSVSKQAQVLPVNVRRKLTRLDFIFQNWEVKLFVLYFGLAR